MRPASSRHRVLRALLFAISIALGAVAASAVEGVCRQERRFAPSEYWFWEGYLGTTGLEPDGEDLVGQLVLDPSRCFRVERAALEDPIQRTRGTKRAVTEWLKRLPEAASWDTDSDGLETRARLFELTGQNPGSPTEWTRWWVENGEYLRWSDEAGRLVVVEEAKRALQPVAEEVRRIKAERYWFLEGRGWLENVRDEGEFVRASGWTTHGFEKVRVESSRLADRGAKKQGYRRAVESLVVSGLPAGAYDGKREILERLAHLTDESFESSDDWIQWWQANADELVLSPNGDHLTVARDKVDAS